MATQVKPDHEFPLQEVAAALFAKAGVTSGLWRLAARLRFSGLTVNLSDRDGATVSGPMPAGVVGVDGLALFAATEPGDLVFDAAEVLAAQSQSKAPKKRTQARKVPSKVSSKEPKGPR